MIPIFAPFFLIVLLLFFSSFFTVRQQSVAIIERFGRYHRTAHAGLNIKIPFVEKVRGVVSLRIQQLDLRIETKTKDNVFIRALVSVQYRVKESSVFDAFYKLANGTEQITAYVYDVVRAEVPKTSLDDVFEKKDSIAIAVKTELTETMQEFGYEIVKALVTDIDPDAKVKSAMNEINEQLRLRIAASERGEAEKILKVKQAEAEAERMRLQGEGIANQRRAIIDGLRQSIDEFQKSIPDARASEVMSIVLMTQYFDTLKEIGSNDKSSTLFMPHSPGGLQDLYSQIRDGVIAGNLASS